ncbi:mevalonate kinase [Maribacter vaceletii]|uniref:Mevalonate kinase n=1 Tax=Maribacter vaceletii TaxID=1206816 RepID=A0A495EEG8_9FLAO|nr:GYDIA family GHMP kinase [Maribacter vaceletii]RKR15272.1 mevalonate kinase [Maribacter vaceletii]
MNSTFYSNGKLLLTGEYAVLDGALSLAIPTKYGQLLTIKKNDTPKIIWTSLDEKGDTWFKATLLIKSDDSTNSIRLEVENKNNLDIDALSTAKTLINILTEAQKLNPFLSTTSGHFVETKLTFPRNWGLGSSSTLINNIASWAKVDAYKLLWNAFSGSAYDIACAQHNYPITYKLNQGKPEVSKTDFNPPFIDNLYFVYLNKKQNSRKGIANYKSIAKDKTNLIAKISELTQQMLTTESLTDFNSLILTHEKLLSSFLQTPTQKEALFSDFEGHIKSLGAWGGDFVLATGTPRQMRYFKRKGYLTLIPYKEMVL